MDEMCDVVGGTTSNTASQPAEGGGGGSRRMGDGGVDEVRTTQAVHTAREEVQTQSKCRIKSEGCNSRWEGRAAAGVWQQRPSL